MAYQETKPLVQNSFSSLATDPLRNFKFHVNILRPQKDLTAPIASLGFVSVSGLSIATESIAYRQGGYNTTVHQIPGQTTFSPVTLQRGVLVGTSQSWDWMRELFSTVAGNGLGKAGNNFRSTVDINVLDHPVTKGPVVPGSAQGAVTSATGESTPVKLRFRLYRAWISALSYSDLNAGDNSIIIEQMTLVHEGFDMKWAKAPSIGDGTDPANSGSPEAPQFTI